MLYFCYISLIILNTLFLSKRTYYVEVSGQSGKEIDIDGINSCIKDGTELK